MIYPEFLKVGDTVGICAPSAGIAEEDNNDFDKSLNNLKKEGYKIKETANVRTGLLPSSTAEIRGKEFNELLKDNDVKIIWSATGGDFLVEMLDYIDEEEIVKNPKWVAGYSDPTSLLYHITTNFDIATLYGRSAGSFDMQELHSSLKNTLEILKGNLIKQESFEMYEKRINFVSSNNLNDEQNNNLNTNSDNNVNSNTYIDGYNLNTKDYWKTPNGDVDITGRLIGGCIDCINIIAGTKFDGTSKFIEKYKDDGIVWYFDNFALKSEDLYYALWRMKELGYFKYTVGIVFGRILFEGTTLDLSYLEAIKRIFGNEMPIIMEADIGHVKPTFTLINGAIGHFVSKNGKGSLEMYLK